MLVRHVKLAVLCFLVFALVLTACSTPSSESGQSDQGAKPAATSGEKTDSGDKIVKVYAKPADTEVAKEKVQKQIAAFEKLNPGYKIKWMEGPTKVEDGKLTTFLNSGVDLPHVFWTNAGIGRTKILANANLIRPLDDLYEKYNWEDKLVPAAYKFAQFDAYNGKMYEFPATLGALQPFYNKKVLEQLNLEIPKTKDEFLHALQVSKDAGITPIAIGARTGYPPGWLFGNIMEAIVGHEKMQNLFFGDLHWNDPMIVEAAGTLKDWVDAGYIDKEAASLDDLDARARFLNDKHLIYVASTWLILDIVAENAVDKFDLAPIPTFTEGQVAFPVGGLGQSWFVPAKVDDPDLSAKWLNFVLTKEYAEVTAQEMSGSDLLASKAAFETSPVNPLLAKGIKSIADGSGFNPSVFLGPATEEAFNQNLIGIIGGLVSTEDAMNNIEAAAQKDKAGN